MTDQTKINVVTIGDPHFKASNPQIMNDFVSQTIQLVEKLKPDFIVILGDVMHDFGKAKESCHSKIIKWMVKMAETSDVFLIIGNHDRPNNQHFLTDNHFFNGIKYHPNITVVDTVKSTEVLKEGATKSVRFIFVPYVPPGEFGNALETLKVPIKDSPPEAIFAHQEFRGAKMGAVVSEKGDIWPDKNPLVISGHIHESQNVGKKVMYVGTPYQTTYKEGSNKGIYVFSFGDGNVKLKRCKLNIRVKCSIPLNVDEFANFELPEKNLFVRILVQGPRAEVLALKKTEKYKTLSSIENVKVILRPNIEKKLVAADSLGFVKTLKQKIRGDENAERVFEVIFA